MNPVFTFSASFGLTLATLISAGISTPSWARDTDIYSLSESAHSESTIKPNVLLVLDNSQSMLAPDGWKEYPGDYDPNVEYLWNYHTNWNPPEPLYRVNEIVESSAVWQSQINTSLGVNTNPMGFVADNPCASESQGPALPGDIAEIQGMLSGVGDTCAPGGFLAWIQKWPLGKEGVGASEDWDQRKQLRNYDRRVYHWLPVGTPENDIRLVSPSLNTFEADDFVDKGIRALINFEDRHRRDYNHSTSKNSCEASQRSLNESGVLTPGKFFSDSEISTLKAGPGLGKFTGQRWLRWDRFYNPTFQNEFAYPGPASNTYFNSSNDPRWHSGLLQANRDGYMDHDRMPIRGRGTGARSNWVPLKADGGGWRGVQSLKNMVDNTTPASNRRVNQLLDRLYPGFSSAHPGYDKSNKWWFYGMTSNYMAVAASDQRLPNGEIDLSKLVAPWGYESVWRTRQTDTPSCSSTNSYSTAQGFKGTFEDYQGNIHRYYDETLARQTCEANNANIANGYCSFTNGNDYKWKRNSTWKWSNRSYFTNEQGEVYGYGGECRRTDNHANNAGAVVDQNRLDQLPTGPAGQLYWVKRSDENSYCRAGNNERQYCDDISGNDNNCRFNRQCKGVSTTSEGYWRRGSVTWQATHDCVGDSDGKGLDITKTGAWGTWSPRYRNVGVGNYSNTIEAILANNPSHQIRANYKTDTGAEIKVKPPAIDVYSANYLNWKWGVKGPNGHPVGRMTRMSVAKKALSDVIKENTGVRFGLMVFNSADNLGNADGGKVVFKVSDMTPANQAALLDAVAGVTANSSTPLAEAMYEAKLYFAGESPWKGTSENDYDASAIVGGKYLSPMFDNPTAENPAQCQKNYSILVTDGDPEFDTDANALIGALSQTRSVTGKVVATNQANDTLSYKNAVASPGEPGYQQFAGRIDTSSPSPVPDLAHHRLSNTQRFSWLDELTYFMAEADLIPTTQFAGEQNVSNFVIGFSGASSEVLKASATFADDDSDFFTADSTESLKSAIQSALQGIRRWTPVRSAPVVGINSKNRAETGEDVYMAFFEPRDKAGWHGTLKRYRIHSEPHDSVELGNMAGVMCSQPDHISAASGSASTQVDLAVTECLVAKQAGAGTETALQHYQTQVLSDGTQSESLVLKKDVQDFFVTAPAFADEAKGDAGGTGWKLINDWLANNGFRKIYARLDTGTDDLTDSVNAVTLANKTSFATRFGLATTQAEDNIKLARGEDPQTGTRLAWMHGDILHSQPALVHYDAGSTNPNQQTLFYLSNDGLLRAVDATTGQELWAFLVDEALCKFETGPNTACNAAGSDPTRLYQRYAGETGSEHIVLADGPLTVDIHDQTATNDRRPNGLIRSLDGDRVTLMFGLRRGGRAYYALDVTDRLSPRFMWKLDPSLGGAFGLMGQSWSKPTIGNIRSHYDTATRKHKPVAIFAGGYDPSFDYAYDQIEDVNGVDTTNYPKQANLNRSASMGLGVYVVDLLSGNLVRWFGPSVTPGPVTNSFSAWDGTASYKTNEGAMRHAIPSDLEGLNLDLDTRGYIDTAYVGDLGGQVWRINFDPMDSKQWNVRQIANLNGDLTLTASVIADNDLPRSIFYPPAVVKDKDHVKVVVGTGAQEMPLLTQTQDLIVMLKDTNQSINPGDSKAQIASDGTLRAPITYLNSSLDGLAEAFSPAGASADELDSGTREVSTDDADDLRDRLNNIALSSTKGWVRVLPDGEKVTGKPMVFNWLIRVPTWSPTLSLNACTPAGLGRLRVYGVNAGAPAVEEKTDANGDLISVFKTTLGPKARGYVDNSTLIFQDGEVRQLINADGVTSQSSMNMGNAIDTEYWYRELEN